jgi:hypothetical protein
MTGGGERSHDVLDELEAVLVGFEILHAQPLSPAAGRAYRGRLVDRFRQVRAAVRVFIAFCERRPMHKVSGSPPTRCQTVTSGRTAVALLVHNSRARGAAHEHRSPAA